MKSEILGIKIDAITEAQALDKIALFLGENKNHLVVTPNAEIILYAHKNPDYADILNRADLALPDGSGPYLLSRFTKQRLPARIPGADFVPKVCELARQKKMKIGILGGRDQETVKKAAMAMRSWGNDVVFAAHGVLKEDWKKESFHEKIVNEMRKQNPDIVFVGFGHPKQEQWMDKYGQLFPSARLMVGCGGTLDFIAGAAKRAPAWMRSTGLEWLWRLYSEPARFQRIFNAVVVFPLTMIYASFFKK
jgi:N-acetylglucosaminyldiphosphoundecaprenol N-acetyl-beta-D-mannosaminyltransferase